MPLVVVHRENKFNEVLKQMRRSGGGRANAYRKIGEIRQGLALGERNVCQTTDHGESRIKNCIKYDLGNGYRLVSVDFGEVVMLCYAGSHDEVNHWLDVNRGQSFTYDKDTKRIGVIVEREIANTPHLPAATTPPEDTRPYLAHISGLDWEQLVPPKSVRRRLLALDANATEELIQEVLQDVQDEANAEAANLALNLIVALRDGLLVVAERHRDVFLGTRQRADEAKPITPEVVKAEANSDTLIVLNDLTEAEFDALWEPSRFQEWMLYLHPGQKRVVVEDIPKPCVFTGVSGSGKTCVLVHRAIRLAKEYPDEPILVLTLNRPLADLIRNHIERLAGGVKYPIRVMAFYEYLESMLKFYGMEDFFTSFGSLLELKDEVNDFIGGRNLTELTTLFDARDEYEIEKLWDAFCADPESQPTKDALSRLTVYLFSQDQAIDAPRYLKEELTLVRSACRLSSAYEGYAKYDRGGRCIQFQDKRREDILRVLRTWERYQLRNGKLDGMELTQASTVALDDHAGSIPDHLRFRCVLVDEFQDFSTLDLELISKIPSAPLNGLFLTGDTAQKIYTKDFDLPQAGLGPGHRVNRSILKNYRNSRQILEAAHLLLESYANEATAKHEGVTVLKPEYAQRDGARPFVCETNDPLRAAWSLAGEWLASGYPGFSICIATANPDVISVRKIRETAPPGIATSRLTGDYQMRADVVVVSDIYNIKGFEFSLIIIVGMGAGEFPPKGVPAGEIWREALRLYVAMTRGRDEVCLVHTGEPSPFLTAMTAAVSPRPLIFEQPAEDAQPAPSPIEAVTVSDVDEPVVEPVIIPTADAPAAEVPVITEPVQVAAVIKPAVAEVPDEVALVPESDAGHPTPVYTPTDQEEMVINGVTLIPIRGEPTVRNVAAALGKSFVQIHNDFMNLGVFTRPDQSLVHAFVFNVMGKYGCAPIFRK
ncbi:MAG: UvrD-helicase domain-containing protein [Opitutaceae bacterium]|jgi:superfamily I DNA/RNA helicase